MIVAARGVFIGERLRELRNERALTQEQLANLAKVHFGSISELENNRRPAMPGTVRKLANALEVDVKELTTGSVNRQHRERAREFREEETGQRQAGGENNGSKDTGL